ncbi:MAG: lysophospholipid acyltransferase family protein [Planctomycetota bacterium]
MSALLAPHFLQLMAWTWKVELQNEAALEAREPNEGEEPPKGLLLTLWHGRMLAGLQYHRDRDYHVLVSQSGDGDISAKLLAAFGYHIIRGSSSRGASRALREMLGALRQRAVVVITPDGPRGPMHSVNPGTAFMARTSGFGIVPVGFACSNAWRLKSWDRYTIPKPFSRIVMCYGDPQFVAPDANSEQLAEATERMREHLLEVERRAHETLGQEFVP